MESLVSNLPVQYGALGILIVFLTIAIVALWRRMNKQQDDFFEQSVQTTDALVELNTLIRDRKS